MRSLTAIKLIMNIKNNIKIYIQDTIHKKNKIRLKDCYDWLSIVSNKKTELTIRIVSEHSGTFADEPSARVFRLGDIAGNETRKVVPKPNAELTLMVPL